MNKKLSIKDVMVKSSERPLGNFIKEGNFILLASQRDYKWDAKDLISFFENIKSDLFIGELDFSLVGTIYLKQIDVENKQYSIIDGQQRFTSFMIIIRVLNEIIFKSNRRENENFYLNKIEPCDLGEGTSDSIIRDYNLLFNSSDETLSSIKKIEDPSKLLSNAIAFDKYINDPKNDISSDDLKEIFNFIKEKVLIIPIIFKNNEDCSCEKFAYDIFVKLNTTGKKLTELELIHSYVWTLDVN
ncbi:MAG: DUF262 domain-containing protein, partial [Mycoplasma sp.]